MTAEGGSSLVRSKVLRAVLEGEREVIAQGEAARASLALANYAFQPNGVDDDGLANVLLSPKRKERALLSGTMFLQPDGGDLVRLQGRLAKDPSFWVRNAGDACGRTSASKSRHAGHPRLDRTRAHLRSFFVAHDLRVFRGRWAPRPTLTLSDVDESAQSISCVRVQVAESLPRTQRRSSH